MATTSELGIPSWRERTLSVERDWALTAGIVSILLGVFMLIRPNTGIATLALVFGIYLLAAGVWRLSRSITDPGRTTGRRIFGIVLGAAISLAGIWCLFNIGASVVLLGITLGAGVILVGIVDLFRNNRENDSTAPWLRITSGILAILVGLVMCIVPLISVNIVVLFGAIVLIAVGIGSLLSMPRKEPHELRN